MADAADSGSSDWEVVSLTASTYAAAPGPTSPQLLLDAHKTESPAPPAHFFMSQHFNLPAAAGQALFTTHLENSNSGCQELESDPAVADGDDADSDTDDFNMPCPENCQSERDDVLLLVSPAGNGLQVEGGEKPLQVKTTTPCSIPDATAGGDHHGHVPAADATAVGSASLPAPAATVSGGVTCNAAHAWWDKTFSFPRGNGTAPLAFRFVFVAGKLQLQGDLSPEFGVHSQTQKINCAVDEPLGQGKVSTLGGTGYTVAQRG